MKPLDFSKPRIPVPAAPPPLPRREKRRSVLLLVSLAIVVAGAGVLVNARMNGSKKTVGTVVAAADPEYCRISGRLVSLLIGAGVQLDGTVPATVGSGAMVEVVGQMGTELDQLGPRAPETIRGAVETVVQALRRAAENDVSLLRAPGFAPAEQSIIRLLQSASCRDFSADLARGDAP